ncbi:unnamed protein product [Polarella glacialis]|uniref:Uncharacterized protein n=1 Tax=Polarella glacialis TaxID=89957 RepID=A0A813GZ03_POLGL|nr:unnamed protein product [Polarella glacialis]CAE8630500.1 unnamed protein product [Polarella glacialis]
MLTSPEDAPALPLSRAGRSSALTEAMAPHAKAQGFLDSVQWSSAAAVPSVVSGAPSSGTAGAALAPSAPQELEEQLAQARAGEARWARIASDLYGRLVEKGLDSVAALDGKVLACAVDARQLIYLFLLFRPISKTV